jgi:TolB-like protein
MVGDKSHNGGLAMWMHLRVISLACLLILATSCLIYAQVGVDEQLDEAYRLYRKAHFEDAIIKTTDILTGGELSKDQETRALEILSMASIGRGYVDQAKAYLEKLVDLDPMIDLDPDEYPPQIMSLWYKIREGRPIPAGQEGGATEIQTIAVMYFDNNSISEDHEQLDALSKGLASMMIYEIAKVSQLKVVERDRINFLVDELKLQQSDLVDKSTAVKIGKLVGAHTLLMGGFMKISKKQFRIDARLVKVETGEIMKAEYVEGKSDEVMRLEKELVVKMLADLDVTPTETEEEAIMEGDDTSFEALYHYSRGLAYEDKKDYVAAFQQYQKALKLSPGYVEAEKKMARLEPFSSQG